MNSCWMKNLNNALPITEINLPGTHNSGAFNASFGYFSNCQRKTVSEQLNMGIRFIDIRVEKKNDSLFVVHSFAPCKKDYGKAQLSLEDVLEDCLKFLKVNPSETILFSLKRDNGASSEEVFDLFFSKYFSNEFWFKENRFPSIGETRGKLILINRCNADIENPEYTDKNTGIDFSGWPYQDKFKGKIFEEMLIAKRNGKAADYCLIQDIYKLNPKEKYCKTILPFIENPPQLSGGIISFFSSTSGLINPLITAGYINKRLEKTALEKNKKYGWIIMDYPTEKFINEIINTNF